MAGAILLPSVVLSQWTFGIEANFFHGLMTKPVKVKQMLQNCYYYYMVVSAVALLLTLPFLFLQVGIGIQVLISGFCLAVFINLFNLPDASPNSPDPCLHRSQHSPSSESIPW